MFRLLTLTLILFFCSGLNAQWALNGNLSSWVYSFETPDNVQQGNFYQGFHLRARNGAIPEAAFNTSFQIQKRGDADWEERVYNTYLDWTASTYQVRLGRQFAYSGVVNGTFDGAMVSLSPIAGLTLKAFGGLDAPLRRSIETAGTDSTFYGAYASYNYWQEHKADVSFVQQERDSEIIWQQVGAGFNGNFLDRSLFYILQYEHNLASSEIQGTRARLTYYWSDWSFHGEYSMQKPRILEDSFFRIFELEEYQQMRGGATYQWNAIQLGLQYALTNYENDHTQQVIATAGNRYGIIGLVFQEGFAGDNAGIYGDIRYPVLNQLTLRLYSSYYNYQRQTTEITEDAVALSAGIDYRPIDDIILRADLQESRNSAYDNDLRGLFRLTYMFNFKSNSGD